MVKKVKLISIDGQKGTAKVQIPGGQYREYPYVYSQLGVVPNSENVKEPMFEQYLVGDDYDQQVVTLSYAGKQSTVNGNFGTVVQIEKTENVVEKTEVERFDTFYKNLVKQYLKDVTQNDAQQLLSANEIQNGSAVVQNPNATMSKADNGKIDHDKTFLKLYYRFLQMLSIGTQMNRNVVTNSGSTYHQENSEFVYPTNYPLRFLLLPTKPMIQLSQITVKSINSGKITGDYDSNTIETEIKNVESKYLQILAYATKAVISFKPVNNLNNVQPFNTTNEKLKSIINMVDPLNYIQLLLSNMTKQSSTVNYDSTSTKQQRIYNFPYIAVFAGQLQHYLRTAILAENSFKFYNNLNVINALGVKVGSKGPLILNKTGQNNSVNIDIWNTIVDTYHTSGISDYKNYIQSMQPSGSFLYNMLIDMFETGQKLTNSSVDIGSLKLKDSDVNNTNVVIGKMLKTFQLFPGAWLSTLQFQHFYNLMFLFKNALFKDYRTSDVFYSLIMLNTIYKYLEIQLVSSERVQQFCYLQQFVSNTFKKVSSIKSQDFQNKFNNYVDQTKLDQQKRVQQYRYNYNFLFDSNMNIYISGFISESEKMFKFVGVGTVTDYIDNKVTNNQAKSARQSITELLKKFENAFGFAHVIDDTKIKGASSTLTNAYFNNVNNISTSNNFQTDHVIQNLMWLDAQTGAQTLNTKPGIFHDTCADLMGIITANVYTNKNTLSEYTSDIQSILNFVANMQVDMQRIYTYVSFLQYVLDINDTSIVLETFGANEKLNNDNSHMLYSKISQQLDNISLATPTTYYPLSLSITYLQNKLGVKHTLQ